MQSVESLFLCDTAESDWHRMCHAGASYITLYVQSIVNDRWRVPFAQTPETDLTLDNAGPATMVQRTATEKPATTTS